ncbi:uncharacterized protein LOC143590366, partial [Bidens hawaiensis]|uniref:uncharacterized protein LOC143590366 n=1 Tax=Bidens hawaiensis TaxID=980011 RepID=UPI00404B8AF1
MAVSRRDQTLSLLAAANNHGDLAVKLSSLKQAKDILLAADLSVLAAELFPYLVELQSSHEPLVRKTLVEMIEEISLKTMEYSPVLMPVLLTLLNDDDSVVARQTIVVGAHIFCKALDELALQFQRHGLVERWLEEIWSWMIKFKDTVFQIALEARSVGPRLLAIKFLETCVLLFMPDNDSRGQITEVGRNAHMFNILRVAGGHPVLDSVALQSEANRCFLVLLDLLSSSGSLPGSITISVINSLAIIGRRRQAHYSSVLSALLDFDASFVVKGAHNPSIQYSLRSAFLGFLRSTHPVLMESRDKLIKALRAINAGDAADQVMRQVDKMIRNNERASRANKDEQQPSHMLKRSTPMDQEHTVSNDSATKRSRYGSGSNTNTSTVIQSDSRHDYSVNRGPPTKGPSQDNGLTPVEQIISAIGALLAEGERGAQSLEILISQIHPELLAEIVVTNMKHLPKNPPPLTKISIRQSGLSNTSSPVSPTVQNPVLTNAVSTSLSATINLQTDPKRDSRRDPRRHDPRRVTPLAGTQSEHFVEDVTESEVDVSALSNKHPMPPVLPGVEYSLDILTPKAETETHIPDTSAVFQEQAPDEFKADMEFDIPNNDSVNKESNTQKSNAQNSMDVDMADDDLPIPLVEVDQLSPSPAGTPVLEETSVELPVVPSYVELTEQQQKDIKNLAITRIIDSYKQLSGSEFMQTRMSLLSRLVAQVGVEFDCFLCFPFEV